MLLCTVLSIFTTDTDPVTLRYPVVHPRTISNCYFHSISYDMFSQTLAARDANAPPVNHTMINLLVVLLVLLILALFLVGGLLFLRARRRARKQAELPIYEEKRLSTSSSVSTHRRVMVRPSESVYVYQEKQNLIDNSNSPPQSPRVPEIHITFPEEYDAAGKRQSGRVVVVHVGDTGVGMEPADGLPAYEKEEGGRFQSIDLERVGGLVEKARNAPSKEFQ